MGYKEEGKLLGQMIFKQQIKTTSHKQLQENPTVGADLTVL